MTTEEIQNSLNKLFNSRLVKQEIPEVISIRVHNVKESHLGSINIDAMVFVGEDTEWGLPKRIELRELCEHIMRMIGLTSSDRIFFNTVRIKDEKRRD